MCPFRSTFEKGFLCIFVVCLSAVTMQQQVAAGVPVPSLAALLPGNETPSSLSQRAPVRRDIIVKRQQQSSDGAGTTEAEQSETTKSGENGGDSRVVSFLDYWYVLLVVLIVVAAFFVCLCACFVKKKRQTHRSHRMEPRRSYRSPVSNPSIHQLGSSTDGQSVTHPHTSSSFIDPTSSPGSLSIDHTPIPSPQPSYASSNRSSGRGSRRKRHRNHSPGHASSESEDTIKPNQARSVISLGSTASSRSLGPVGMPRVIRTESQSSGERSVRSTPSSHSRSHRRSNSNTVVKITPIVGGVDGASLRSASSMASMASVGSNHSSRSNRSNVSNRSGVMMRSQSNPSPNTLVEVDVKVHLCNDEEREARTEIAAALAESARQLAQSAANFDQEEDEARQKRGWYSRSLPHHSPSSASSLPFRPSLGTTHSLPLHGNRRRLFTSHSSTNLPPHGREHVYTPNLPSSGPTHIPTASLDRPRHMVSVDHPNPTHYAYENYQRGSPSHWPPPTSESPLSMRQNGRLNSPSQRSLSSNSEYTPGHYNAQLPPAHMRPQRLLSRRVSEPGIREVGGVYQNPHPPYHGYVNQNRLRPLNGTKVANLDFHSLKSLTPQLNGVTTPTSGRHAQPEDYHFQHDVCGVRSENGSDSNTSTLCGSSHSSTLDNKNRLSRVSEKSEQNENDSDQQQAKVEDNEQGLPRDGGDEVVGEEVDGDPLVDGGEGNHPVSHKDERRLTMPGHYRKVAITNQAEGGTDLNTQVQQDYDPVQWGERLGNSASYIQDVPLSPSSSVDMSVSSVNRSPPPRKQKPRPLQHQVDFDPELRDGCGEEKDTTSVCSTLPRSPVSSTCLSSQSVQSIQSVRDEAAVHNEGNTENVHPASGVEGYAPVSDDVIKQNCDHETPPPSTTHPSHNHTPKAQSNAIGFKGANNEIHLDRENASRSQGQRSKGQTMVNGNGVSLAEAHMDSLNHRLGPPLSYPLHGLLSQPLSYDMDSDDVVFLDLHHGAHYHHHGNMHHPQVGHHHHRSGVNLHPNVPSAHGNFHGVIHGSLDRRRPLPAHDHTSFNPILVRSARARTSPGLPNVVVPPPLRGGAITVDIDV